MRAKRTPPPDATSTTNSETRGAETRRTAPRGQSAIDSPPAMIAARFPPVEDPNWRRAAATQATRFVRESRPASQRATGSISASCVNGFGM